ncbi:MAG TPA: hypothetical protein VGE21_00100 [Flavobacteriales bacterium]
MRSITTVVLLAGMLLGCGGPQASIVGRWSGWMTVKCSQPGMLPPNYRPLTISLDLQADGQCTNVHGSGIGADITSHGTYQQADTLLMVTNPFGADTLIIQSLTDTALVLRRAPYENGCVHYFSMMREAPKATNP